MTAVGASVHVIIDTTSKQDAELVSELLPRPAEAGSARGYGFVKVRCRGTREVREIIDAARGAVERHGLTWLRVRVGDDEHVFRRR